MAEYTMELWEVLELESDIGLCHYPIFDEDYRDCLNNKIIQHFWNREIGMETIAMFKQQLRRKMNEIMPYWNQHYVASQIQFDPLKTVAMKTMSGTEGESTVAGTGESTSTGTGETDSTSDAKSRAVSSTLPQVMLSGNGDYAESAQDNVSQTTATGTNTENRSTSNTENQTTTSTGNVDSETNGYTGSPAVLIAEYRATFVNTDMDIINQLEPLFMGIWGSTDDYFERGYPYYGYFGHRAIAF